MRALRMMFRSLASRNLKLLFGGQAISVIGTWMQKTAQAWLVLQLTDSGTWLGVTAALQQVPTLVMGLWGGLLADRFDKRRLLLASQSSSMLPALALGILTATGLIELWMVLALALLLGIIDALDKPARQTFVAEIIEDRSHLTNAVTLNNTVTNLGKVAGPAIAGVLIVEVGLPVTFFLNAASFIPVIVGLLLIRSQQALQASPVLRARGQIMLGLRYVRSTPHLLGPLAVMAVCGTVAFQWSVTLPVFVHDTFGGDARVLGFMFSAMGIGAVLGGLVLAGLLRASTASVVGTGLVFSALSVLLAFTPALAVAMVLLFLIGAAHLALRSVASSYLQLIAEPHMRGRVVALLLVALNGTDSFGGPLTGWIAEFFGADVAFAVGGTATAAALLAMVVYLRRASGLSTTMVARAEVAAETAPDLARFRRS